MPAFEFHNPKELGTRLDQHGVKYLFFGTSGAILLGYSDTTPDVDLYVDKQRDNCEKLVQALLEFHFRLTESEQEEIRRGKYFIQLRNGPFDNRQKDRESLPRLLSFRECLRRQAK